MSGRLPIDYREQIDAIQDLPGDWYASQEIPPRLITNLGNAPLVNEWELESQRYAPTGLITWNLVAVLICAANGLTRDETARLLMKSHHTIERQRKQAIAKLKARNMTQAVATAIRLGILVPADQQEHKAA